MKQMRISSKRKRIILQIIPFGLVSLLFNIVYSLLEKGILGTHPVYPSTGNPYNFNFIIPAIVSLLVGLCIGAFEVLYLAKFFQKGGLLQKLLFKTVIYLLVIICAISAVAVLTNAFEHGVSPFDAKVWDYFYVFFSDFAFWSVLLYYGLAIVLCLLYNEISDNVGQSVLVNFFTGKYHRPIEEERVYMFLDMKSSTTIAEKLGHVLYFEMLNEYYSDLSDAIIKFGGEIYQYVGDEVIITWKLKNDFANNCLDCFFAMRKALEKKSPEYHMKYGVAPTFKAGIHLGKITTGEIGVIKKEIIFSGDVLNTTARIQGLCNKYGVELLVSGKIVEGILANDRYFPKLIGEELLRGRNQKINLFTIDTIDFET